MVGREPLCQDLAQKGNAGELLPQGVMQIIPDALPFAFADLDQLAL